MLRPNRIFYIVFTTDIYIYGNDTTIFLHMTKTINPFSLNATNKGKFQLTIYLLGLFIDKCIPISRKTSTQKTNKKHENCFSRCVGASDRERKCYLLMKPYLYQCNSYWSSLGKITSSTQLSSSMERNLIFDPKPSKKMTSAVLQRLVSGLAEWLLRTRENSNLSNMHSIANTTWISIQLASMEIVQINQMSFERKTIKRVHARRSVCFLRV